MVYSRAATRTLHTLRHQVGDKPPRPFVQRSFTATRSRRNAWTGHGAHHSSNSRFGPAVTVGCVGGGVVLLAWFLWENYIDPRPTSFPIEQAKNYQSPGPEQFRFDFREITPGPTDEVIRSLKEVADKYSPWIPGGREFVEQSFSDLETVREKHGTEVNEIVRDTYEELRDVSSRKGTSLETVNATWYILSRRLEELSSLAGDVAQQILESNPSLRDRLDGSFEQLRRLGDRLGPGAKREVDETFCEVSKIVKQGVDDATVDRINRIVQDKARHIKSRSEQAWYVAMEQMQPMLDRNPRVKRIVDENIDTLRQARAKEVSEKIRQAVMSGSTGELERFIKDISKKTQQHSSGSLSNWLSRLPDGSKILPQLQQLKEAAETKSADAEQLARETLNDVSRILDQRTRQAESLLRSRSRDQGNKSAWL
ncbi:hypothetical protein M409DRAFT_22567 [Zasmidium cellare ATCC 36951]|uniref:Uncharacterized protein n=1 Tax=Zasmidium cellare ATCC 36951 TaxID=1080233 RepID=A0A6A6CJ11_ZASCE|nr:uncharacterized protein M409DRAFT_22567 [Zasmidium cellare ATCC 36951]KAF2167135.1 hypothetical protein M409DRAFT_22567 [Zasmidium cellare ATCC 36951]